MDTDGLSVFDGSRIGVQECIESSSKCYGLATLHVGSLRDAGFVVIRDPEYNQKCLIVNAPFENPNDADEERRLDNLAASARIKILCKYKKPRDRKNS